MTLPIGIVFDKLLLFRCFFTNRMIKKSLLVSLFFFTKLTYSNSYSYTEELEKDKIISDQVNWKAFESSLNFGINDGKKLWVKVIPPPKRVTNQILKISNFYADISAIGIDKNGNEIELKRYLKNNHYPTYLIAPDLEKIFVKIKSNGILYLPLQMKNVNDFESELFIYRVFHGVFLGGLIVFLIISLLFYAFFKHQIYWRYSFYLITSIILYFGVSGSILYLIEMDKNALIKFTLTALSLYYVGIGVFTQSVLQFKGKWYKRYRNFFILATLGSITTLLISNTMGMYYNNAVPIALMLLLPSVTVYKLFKEKRKSLKFYLIGWVLYYLGAGSMALMNVGLLPLNMFTENGPYTGMLLECLFFTLASFYVAKTSTLEAVQSIDLNGFSEREREVIDLLIQGKSNKDIADNLFVSINTIKFHLSNIYKKAEVKNKAEAMSYFLNNN